MSNAQLIPGVSATGNLANKLGRTKRNLSADTNNGYANIWHYLDKSADNSGPTLAANDDIGDGTTNCRGVLAAASASGKPLDLPPGIYKIDSNVTVAQNVRFAHGAIIKPASGVTVTLSAGYIADDSQQIFDLSLGGTIAVNNRNYLSVMHFGAKPDYVYPTTGTDNGAIIQACFDAAQVMAVALGQRVLVVIPIGPFKTNTVLSVPSKIDLDMTGALLHYRGSSKSTAILTIGSGAAPNAGFYRGLNISGNAVIAYPTIAEQKTFACVRVAGAVNCEFTFANLSASAIGLLLEPDMGASLAYNKFHGVTASTIKVGIEIRGNYSEGFANENDFFSTNITHGSSANGLGALCGVKFSTNKIVPAVDHTTDTFTLASHGLTNGSGVRVYSEATNAGLPAGLSDLLYYYVVNAATDTFQLSTTLGGSAVPLTSNGTGNLVVYGYSGQNNNRFYGACFQVNNHSATYELSVSKVVTTGVRYANITTDKEYYCSAGGTVATVPTHTSGSVTDGNGVTFTYVGPYRRVPVWFDGAGNFNIFYGCRWESGYGGFCLVSQAATTTSCRITDNEMQVYTPDTNAKAYPVIDSFTDITANNPTYLNKVSFYGQNDPPRNAITNIHMRAIGSSGNLCVKGMFFRNTFTDAIAQYKSGTFALCKNSLWSNVGMMLAWAADIEQAGALTISHRNAGVDKGRAYLWLSTNKFVALPVSSVTTTAYGASSWNNTQFAYYRWLNNSDTDKSAVIKRNPTSSAKYVICGYASDSEISDVYAEGVLNGNPTSEAPRSIKLLTPYEPDSNLGNRFAYGTPDVGYFLSTGEYISNINTATSQPLGWTVKTAGILAPAWVTATAVRKGELRLSDTNKIYAAQAAGTTGATAPTGTTTSSDGTVTWEYLGTEAVLIATTQVY